MSERDNLERAVGYAFDDYILAKTLVEKAAAARELAARTAIFADWLDEHDESDAADGQRAKADEWSDYAKAWTPLAERRAG